MKVAMVSEHASPLAALGGVDAGGQNVHVAALATMLGRRGVDVTVHTRRDDPALPGRVPLGPRVVVEHVDAGPAEPIGKDDLLPHMDEFADELLRRWQADPPDLVHAHFWMSGRAALAAARPLAIPVTQTFHALGVVKRRHQGEADPSPGSRIAEEVAIIDGVDRVIATCSDEVFELTRLGADHSAVSVVPCGVDLDRFRPDGPSAPPATPGLRRLVAVTRLVERKGIADVVAALPHVPGAELVVAGGPPAAELDADPEARRLRALADDLRVAARLHLLGQVDNDAVPALLRSADVAVCTPWYEPFGMVALEAMACGVPVVASAVGGLVDTVVDGHTGLLVPPRDTERLVAALRRLLADPTTLRQFGDHGAARARERYGWERIAAATHDVYADVLDRRAARRRGPEVASG